MEHEGLLVAEREIEVNNYDIDAMGIVSNIVYIPVSYTHLTLPTNREV